MKRRDFLLQLGAGSFLTYLGLESCNADKASYAVREASGNSATGHLLREPFLKPLQAKEQFIDTLIVGAGVSGLSAARFLHQHSSSKFLILELASEAGGNALGGRNQISSFPWASHYLPIPSLQDMDLISFLSEVGVITHFEKGVPFYKEEYLCFDQKERLFVNGKWQDGLIPYFNIASEDKKQISKFIDFVHELRLKKDNSDKYYFSIPLHLSSKDNEWMETHNQTAKSWLESNGYSSPYLHWYINYCTSDDYGSSYEKTSAWAMLHYFASRRGEAMNASYDDVLTWPEGNGFLSKKLIDPLKLYIKTNEIVLHIEQCNTSTIVYHKNTLSGEWTRTKCNKLILNTPYHVVKKLIPYYDTKELNQAFQSYPWIVANMSVSKLPEKQSQGLCWDNVIYNSGSLGYIVANHQSFNTHPSNYVFTYYKALNTLSASEERKKLYVKSIQDIHKDILAEMKTIYPDIEKYILDIEIKKLGHGMISPKPGLIHSPELGVFNKPYGNIYFAHSDFCGISIFEEAFARGIAIAKQTISA